MKLISQISLKTIVLFIMTSFYSAIAFAQDSSATTTKEISTSSTTQTTTVPNDWYNQPWVWIVGGIIFIVILILLFSNNNKTVSSDKVTVTKTVKTERDTD